MCCMPRRTVISATEFIGDPQVAKLSMEDLGLEGDNRGFGARVVKLIGE
jgi:hypothetical protein